MSTFSRLLTDADAGLFILLALASIREYRRGHGSASAWAATAFVTLGAIASLAFLPMAPASAYHRFWYQLFIRVIICVLIAFPYFLYRIAATFRPPSRLVRRAIGILTFGVMAAFFLSPRFPGPNEPRPPWIVLFTFAIVIQWTATSAFAAWSLWIGGRGRPIAARYRMRLLATGTAALNLTIYISALAPQSNPNKPNHAIQILQLAVGLTYFIGLAPPRVLTDYWQRPEQGAARRAISRLMSAVTAQEVADTLLPHLTVLIGAQSAALYNKNGTLAASFGDLPPEAQTDVGESDPSQGKLRAALKSGGSVVVRSNTYSTLFGAEKIPLLQSFADMADLALARCEAIAREREFISNAAHELRTPLTTMTGLAAMLAVDRTNMNDEQITKCVEGLVRQGNRARELVNTMLDLAQIERGSVAFADEVLDLSSIVDDSLDFTPAPSDRQIQVEVPDDARVRGDAERLEQVVINLLTNAYRHGGKTINIEAHNERDGIVLSIGDDGAGVPADLVPRLFDPFTRGAAVNGTGSGLGLAICRRIVEGLGGTISYDPTPQWPSRFKVELRKAA